MAVMGAGRNTSPRRLCHLLEIGERLLPALKSQPLGGLDLDSPIRPVAQTPEEARVAPGGLTSVLAKLSRPHLFLKESRNREPGCQ